MKENREGYPHKLFISPASNALATLLGVGGAYAESLPLAALGVVAGGVAGYYWDKYDDRRIKRLALMSGVEIPVLTTPTVVQAAEPTFQPSGIGQTRPGIKR